jgi:hypothetical protein
MFGATPTENEGLTGAARFARVETTKLVRETGSGKRLRSWTEMLSITIDDPLRTAYRAVRPKSLPRTMGACR